MILGVPPRKGETVYGTDIKQNFTPIGVTIAEISVTKHIDTSTFSEVTCCMSSGAWKTTNVKKTAV